MAQTITIELSWPAKPLWQNRPYHWATVARVKKEARRQAYWLCRMNKVPADPNARLVFSFHPPDNRRRDLHNMPATQKAAIDGISDAMKCDDENFRCVWPEKFGEAAKGGKVVVQIEVSD